VKQQPAIVLHLPEIASNPANQDFLSAEFAEREKDRQRV
jgi:hypothetical protein